MFEYFKRIKAERQAAWEIDRDRRRSVKARENELGRRLVEVCERLQEVKVSESGPEIRQLALDACKRDLAEIKAELDRLPLR